MVVRCKRCGHIDKSVTLCHNCGVCVGVSSPHRSPPMKCPECDGEWENVIDE